jgi:hypothetical protein
VKAITTGSHEAFMSGFGMSLTIGALVALVAAAGALIVRRGENAGSAAVAV